MSVQDESLQRFENPKINSTQAKPQLADSPENSRYARNVGTFPCAREGIGRRIK